MNVITRDWVDVGALNDVPQRGARVVRTAEGCVAVFRTSDDNVYALDNACPHKKGPLAEGIVHGHAVTCPLHNWVISFETGEAQGADNGRVATYAAKVEDGRILIEAEFLKSRAPE